MTIRNRIKFPAIVPATALAATAWVVPGTALALSFDKGGWSFDVDTTLGAAAQWRTESRDKELSTSEENNNWNFNDGNNNFDSGSLTSAKVNFILEVAGQYENFSFFIRGDGLYDTIYMDQKSDLSKENYESYNGAIINGGTLKRGEFPDETRDEHGKRVRLLEAFVNYEFDIGSQYGSVRLGRQVIAWGEALFYQSVNGLQNPVDAAVALSPGVEIKEVFLPTNALNLKWSFTDQISAEAYYKLEWEEFIGTGVGSFLSPNDTIGPGAERVLAFGQNLPVVKPVDADDDGQYGAALRYVTEYGTNFSLSYVRGHANTPAVQFVADVAAGEAFLREVYVEDINFWQFGVSTIIGDTNVYADVIYSDNAPFTDRSEYLTDDLKFVFSDATRGHYRQAVIGLTDLWTAFPWLSERIDVAGEVMYQSNNLGTGDRDANPYGITDDAWAYQFNLGFNYFAVLPGLDVKIPISFRHDLDGYGASAGNSTWEDQMQASIGVEGAYLSNWEFTAKYSFYFGNDDVGEPLWSDRDNFAISAKYTF